MKSGWTLSRLPIAEADIRWSPTWLDRDEATALLGSLRGQIAWETHRIKLFGREVDSPRLSCWIGDPGTGYTYSRTRFEPHRWPPALAAIREQVSEAAGVAMNSVLANLYRDGKDSMGWHSDDEPELGERPVIASLSLGATRRFVFKHRREPVRKFELELPHGSLLLMSGDTQANWRHALPRTARPVGPRINLTFRRIGASAAR